MPHIHVEPDQHDMTVGAYIVRQQDGEWQCLIHMHRKIGKLLQIGGHIELNQTPWQAVADEVETESGFTLDQLDVVQQFDVPDLGDAIAHPAPFSVNTHYVGDEHYHSELCYGFIANAEPKHTVEDGESNDFRWVSMDELHAYRDRGEVIDNAVREYDFLVAHIDEYVRVPAAQFSLEKPHNADVTYKWGKPSDKR